MKVILVNLDDRYMDGNIEKEEYDSEMQRFKDMKKRYKEELKETE